MKRVALILFLIFSMGSLARGTAQIADRIIIDGEEWAILSCPLESLDSIHYYTLRNKLEWGKSSFTALYRGYIARWSISDNELFLDNINSLAKEDSDFPFIISTLKDYVNEEGRIFASWFSGEIVAAQGGVIRDEAHLFFARNHEREIVLTIEEGKLVSKSKVYHNYTIGDDYHNWLQRLTPIIKNFPTEKYKLDKKRYFFNCELKKMNGKWEITMFDPKIKVKNKRKLKKALEKLINKQENPHGGYLIHDKWEAPGRFVFQLKVHDGEKLH